MREGPLRERRGVRTNAPHTMDPLDLSVRPPRAPRAMLAGLMFLPRTIDKLRSELPGGNPGRYINEPRGFSAYMIRRVGLDMDELRATVAAARDEDEVTAWVRERIDPARAEEANRKLETFTSERMSPEDKALLAERHPVMHARPELTNVLDILTADDAYTFAQRA